MVPVERAEGVITELSQLVTVRLDEIEMRSIEWGRALNAILPPGEVTLLLCTAPRGAFGSPGEDSRFDVRVTYADLGGHQWETNVRVRWRPQTGGWMVAEIDVRAAGAPDDDAVMSGDMLEP